MFEFLTTKFEDLFYKIRNRGKLSPNDLDKSLREIKLALLEADVNFKVVKYFIEGVKKKAIGEKILESLTPSQQIIKIVNEEITAMLGNSSSGINFSGKSPTIILYTSPSTAEVSPSDRQISVRCTKCPAADDRLSMRRAA